MKNTQLASQLNQLVKLQRSYSKPYAKVAAKVYDIELPEYVVTDYMHTQDFKTLREAQHYATTLNVQNREGLYEVTRTVGNTVKRWFGKIAYGPEKFVWIERVDHAEEEWRDGEDPIMKDYLLDHILGQ